MAFQKDKPAYYMPLSSNALKNGLTGPSPSVFSAPKMQYSKETQDFVKLLMDESKLTSSQKSGFQSILRSGKSLPERPEDVARRKREYKNRQIAHGLAKGLNMDHCFPPVNYNTFRYRIPESKRSLNSIKASGAFDPPNLKRNYVRVNPEQEKARLAYKMAYGRNPTGAIILTPRKKDVRKANAIQEKPISELKQDRFAELVDEVKDRAEFLSDVSKIKKDKAYRTRIITQMKDKIAEMKTLCPSQVDNALADLRLQDLDRSFAEMRI